MITNSMADSSESVRKTLMFYVLTFTRSFTRLVCCFYTQHFDINQTNKSNKFSNPKYFCLNEYLPFEKYQKYAKLCYGFYPLSWENFPLQAKPYSLMQTVKNIRACRTLYQGFKTTRVIGHPRPQSPYQTSVLGAVVWILQVIGNLFHLLNGTILTYT